MISSQPQHSQYFSRPQYFARVTSSHLACGLSPSAIALHYWGLIQRAAGIPFVFEMSKWQSGTSQYRRNGRAYSRATFYRAMKELIDRGLMEVFMADRGKVEAAFYHPTTGASGGCLKNETENLKTETTPIYRDPEKKCVSEKKFENDFWREEEEVPQASFCPQDQSESLADSQSIDEDKLSAAPDFAKKPQFLPSLRKHSKEAIAAAAQTVREMGSLCDSQIAVFLYSLKHPTWRPLRYMTNAAAAFERRWHQDAKKAEATYQERREADRPNRKRRRFVIPTGPWLNEKGQLREDFMDWCVQEWMAKFSVGKELGNHRRKSGIKGDIFAYFKNDPSRLDEMWAAYVEDCIDVVNGLVRLAQNQALKSSDKEEFVRAATAIKANADDPDPDELDSVYERSVGFMDTIAQLEGRISGGAPEAPSRAIASRSIPPEERVDALEGRDASNSIPTTVVDAAVESGDRACQGGTNEPCDSRCSPASLQTTAEAGAPPERTIFTPADRDVPKAITTPRNPAIAEIVERMRMKGRGVDPDRAVDAESEAIDPEAQALVLGGINAIAGRSATFSRPISPEEKSEESRGKMRSDSIGTSAETLSALETRAREGEEFIAQRKAELLERLEKEYGSGDRDDLKDDPYGGLDW